MKTLGQLRAEITRIDTEILRLLDERLKVVGHVAEAKAATGAPIHDPAREEAVLAHARKISANPNAAVALMETLMRVSREHQFGRMRPPQ